MSIISLSFLEPNSEMFFFNTNPVCYSFLEQTFGFSRDLQSSVKGTTCAQNAICADNNGKDGNGEQLEIITSFLESLAASTADSMPDSEERHLPYIQESAVFGLFVVEFRKLSASWTVPSQGYFYTTWAELCRSRLDGLTDSRSAMTARR